MILLPKNTSKPNIHRLRLINTYEADYNFILKFFLTQKEMDRAEREYLLGSNKTGGRKDMSAVETSIDNELILESHQTKSEDLYVHQDDDIDCYGKIIRDHEIRNSRKYEIEDNVCKLHYNIHNRM